jgi:predicted flap endonuclease-1-like 5' DNA nuclease
MEVFMASLKHIKGIEEGHVKKLNAAGVSHTHHLLSAGGTAKGRADLAGKTAIEDKHILHLVNLADLNRIKGVGREFSDLLEAAGVDTVAELAQRRPESLQAKMAAVNAEQKRVRRVPTLSEVTGWVEQAKTLPRAVSH